MTDPMTGESAVDGSSSEDNMSDLDEDIETLARRSCTKARQMRLPGECISNAAKVNAQEDTIIVTPIRDDRNEVTLQVLDEDIELLARRSNTKARQTRLPGKSISDAAKVNAQEDTIIVSPTRDNQNEVTLQLSDDEGPSGNNVAAAEASVLVNSSSYTLRERKRRMDFSIHTDYSDEEDDEAEKAAKKYKATKQESISLDVLSLTSDQIQRYIDKPRQLKAKNTWRFNSSAIYGNTVNPKLQDFFKKNGGVLEHLQLMWNSAVPQIISVQKDVLYRLIRNSPNLKKITLTYMHPDEVKEFLEALKLWKGKLSNLKQLRLTSVTGDKALKREDLALLLDCGIKWSELELGDFLWEDCGPEPLQHLLDACKDSLKSLIIHGGFKGTKKERFILNFPKMSKLETLSICPKYSFQSEMKNPFSKKARVVRLDLTVEKEEPFKFAVKFTSDLPELKNLTLGNLVEMEELPFSYVKKLKTFRCGSYWNLTIRFPIEGSRSALQGSAVTLLQLPDALKDPSFVPKLATFFPNVKRVWINLPSVPVLRSFFKNFGSSKVEELTLKTQFDFESLMESCLLPEDSDALRRSPLTQTQVDTLKEYKWFSDYVRYYNIELPLEAEDLMEGNSAGIRSLKCLKRLHLEHVPRTLLIPNPEEERKWFDYNCKFLGQTFGYMLYPFSKKCHLEILGMDLDQYTWKNLKHTERDSIAVFRQVGYTDMPEADVLGLSDEEEDLFVPIGKVSGVNVAIQPSMLLPDYFKSKDERE